MREKRRPRATSAHELTHPVDGDVRVPLLHELFFVRVALVPGEEEEPAVGQGAEPVEEAEAADGHEQGAGVGQPPGVVLEDRAEGVVAERRWVCRPVRPRHPQTRNHVRVQGQRRRRRLSLSPRRRGARLRLRLPPSLHRLVPVRVEGRQGLLQLPIDGPEGVLSQGVEDVVADDDERVAQRGRRQLPLAAAEADRGRGPLRVKDGKVDQPGVDEGPQALVLLPEGDPPFVKVGDDDAEGRQAPVGPEAESPPGPPRRPRPVRPRRPKVRPRLPRLHELADEEEGQLAVARPDLEDVDGLRAVRAGAAAVWRKGRWRGRAGGGVGGRVRWLGVCGPGLALQQGLAVPHLYQSLMYARMVLA